jgi:hypothetical protein
LVIDFDLANWTLTGTTVSATNNAFLKQGSSEGLDDEGRDEDSDQDGIVSNLSGTAPNFTFTITDGDDTINVATTAATIITNSDGSANATLANGQRVEVNGTFNTTTQLFDASDVVIRIGGDQDELTKVKGLVTAFDATAGTVTVSVEHAEGFMPTSTSITIQTTTNTRFFGWSGVSDSQTQFFSELMVNASRVGARGTLSGTTLTAKRIHIIGGASTDMTMRLVAVSGTSSNVSASAGTFDLMASEVEGAFFAEGQTIHVTTSSTTQFSNNGQSVTAEAFFAALNPTLVVQVRGTLDLPTLTLTADNVSTGQTEEFHF